jgi:Cof subfamily protein (haloacid dehalogenase superfamily)
VVGLVASDLDGTLLRSDGTLSERTRAALRGVREAGAHVVLVSARPLMWMREIAAEAGASDLVICCNGAVVHDLAADRPLWHDALPSQAATAIVRALRQAAPGVAFACERGDIQIREPAYQPLWVTPDMHPRTDALEFVREPVSKLVAQHPRLAQVELYELALAHGDVASVTYSGESLIEISAAGVTKAFALERLCALLEIERGDVVAFGDMPNDAAMLAWAGHGVAVGNAHPVAVAAADEVTASNDADGVALVLERLLQSR